MIVFWAMMGWSVAGLVVFVMWYFASLKPRPWQIWTMALLCGPAVFGLVAYEYLMGGEL